MKKNTWLLISLIAVIFVSGGVAGFFTGRMTAPTRRSRKRHKFPRSTKEKKVMFKKHIYKRLKLTEKQKESVQVIVDNWLDEMGKLRQRHAPQYLTVFNDFYSKITPMLTPEQIVELDKWRNKFKRYKSTNKTIPVVPSSKKGDNNASK